MVRRYNHFEMGFIHEAGPGADTPDLLQLAHIAAHGRMMPQLLWRTSIEVDRMTDEAWHRSREPLIVCSRGSLVELAALLPDSSQDRHTLFRILAQAVHHWASPLGQPEGKVVPFKVLLLCDRDEEAVRLRQDVIRALQKRR